MSSSYDDVIAANPPRITWAPNGRGVLVAVKVIDPHMTGGPNGDKTHCRHNHEFTPENTILKSDGTRRCRTCKKRQNDARGEAA